MLKNNHLKYITATFSIAFIVACSTKKDSLVNRNWHALNSQYNTIYNGDVALQAGINELKSGYTDDFWEILPVERMQIDEEMILPGQKGKNPNFTRAEDKAVKAIQKHGMNIEGKERNMQMDEAHLLLGKARYYDKRFIPALEAFNYILYKYSNSDKINEAKIWREKTNLRLENDGLAVKNLSLLLKRNDLKPHILSDANAILAQAYINLDEKNNAIKPLKQAIQYAQNNEEKARYRFILGQVYQSLNYADSAYAVYQQVIDMKRKSPKPYVIQSHARQASLIDVTKDTIVFYEKYRKLLKDRENRPYLDVLNHQRALFYDKLKMQDKAVVYYNKSLGANGGDSYLMASNYRNLAKIYFDKAKYEAAGKYYDSTLTRFTKKNREYFIIEKRRKNLDDVIKYEGIAKANDSLLYVTALSDSEKEVYYKKYIKTLMRKDSIAYVLAKKKAQLEDNRQQNENNAPVFDPNVTPTPGFPGRSIQPLALDDDKNKFYFYNPTTVGYGKIEFVKKWGKRALVDNWRWSNQVQDTKSSNQNNDVSKDSILVAKKEHKKLEEKYTVPFYTSKLPTSKIVLDSLAKERNIAYFNLGQIYKEKFFENKLAEQKFETLLKNNPEERFVLPSKYHLFKLYQLSDPAKEEVLKNEIVASYPNTRYAQLVSGQIVEDAKGVDEPAGVYKAYYKQFENQEYTDLLAGLDKSLIAFEGHQLVPKFHLLRATTLGKLRGLEAYKSAMQQLVKLFPDTEEAKQADEITRINIPHLEAMKLVDDSTSTKWKVLYKVGKKEDKATVDLNAKINQFLKDNQYTTYKTSFDVYTENQNFIVIHGISSIEYARFVVQLLAKTKEYMIKEPAHVISSENYTVVQTKKNLEEYLKLQLKL